MKATRPPPDPGASHPSLLQGRDLLACPDRHRQDRRFALPILQRILNDRRPGALYDRALILRRRANSRRRSPTASAPMAVLRPAVGVIVGASRIARRSTCWRAASSARRDAGASARPHLLGHVKLGTTESSCWMSDHMLDLASSCRSPDRREAAQGSAEPVLLGDHAKEIAGLAGDMLKDRCI